MLTRKTLRNLGLGTLSAVVAVFGFLGGRAVAEQPHMRAALDHLRIAREQLQVAEHDKGGHRARALRLVTDAMGQVEDGIQFERNR